MLSLQNKGMHRKEVRPFWLFLLSFSFFAGISQTQQTLKGKVFDIADNSNGLPGAVIKVKNKNTVATTDPNGKFSIEADLLDTLLTYYTGYRIDTSIVRSIDNPIEIRLTNSVQLKEVEVEYKGSGTELAMINTMKIETLNERSLMKAACCNLSESFETNPSVDVNFADAVSGAKQIQLLGLGGQYAQITKENMPYMRGLASSYGLTFIPGTWIKSIQLGKGAGSVVNGFESFTGQINTELQPPENSDKLLFNAYGNENGRNEYNLNLNRKMNQKWNIGLLSHVSFNPMHEDKNHDGFLDIPTGRQYNFANKYAFFSGRGFEWQFGGSYMDDSRNGGQGGMNFHQHDSTMPYLIAINNKKWDVYSKSGYVFKRPSTSMGLQLHYLQHDLNSGFGSRNYFGKQNSAYANFIFESYIGNTNHKYKAGASMLNDVFDEQFAGLKLKRNETNVGVFGEYIWNVKKDVNFILGSRLDHNNYYGWFYTPRVHARFAFNENKTVFRASGGRAQRTANVFAENMGLMASSRNWYILGNDSALPYGLRPEIAWNYGINFTQKFSIGYREAYITIDIYRTDFTEQVVVDMDQSSQWVLLYNLYGSSYSNTGQAEFGWEIRKRLFFKTAYRYVDNKMQYITEMREKPLVSKHRAFANIGYETRNGHWMFDATVQYNGSKRLPDTQTNPPEYQRGERSPEFYNVLGQITYLTEVKNFKFDVYLGVENALNYKQNMPIVSSGLPYSKYFDASMVWGPIYGRMLYAGLRFKIK